MNNIFKANWIDCLIEQLKVSIAENRNIEGIKEALLLAGVTNAEIQVYFVTETMTNATVDNLATAVSFNESIDACS